MVGNMETLNPFPEKTTTYFSFQYFRRVFWWSPFSPIFLPFFSHIFQSEESPAVAAAAGVRPGLWRHRVLRRVEGLQWSLRVAAGLGDLGADGWRGRMAFKVER